MPSSSRDFGRYGRFEQLRHVADAKSVVAVVMV